MKATRMGRPRAKLPKARTNLTTRVRRLIDYAHDGNVREASQASGIAYATLRDLYTGKSTNPSLRTLTALADAYGVYAGWFTDESQPADVPGSGYVLMVRGFKYGATPKVPRSAVIPFASYPLPNLVRILDDELEAQAATPSRPIIGDGLERDSRLGLGEFILGPLLLAEEQARVLLIPDSEPWSQDGWGIPHVRDVYVRRLKALGRYWETIFDDVLHSVRNNPAI